MIEHPFTLGVNYWPRRKAMYWWSDFDAGEVREEFDVIRDIGMTVVRLFLLWDDFQPTPDAVAADCLRDLETVADIAAERGLGLDVTFFTGHMSGPNWAPRWLLNDEPMNPRVRQLVSRGQVVNTGYGNPYSDPIARRAERLQLREVVGALKGHPGVWLWNLGNEPDLFAWPPTAEAGRAWVREMSQLIKSIDPTTPVTCGLHADSLFRDNGLRVHDVFGETDVAVMHSYPMYAEGLAQHPLDEDYVAFTCALTSALSGKPVLMEEFGGCTVPPGQPSQTWSWTGYGAPIRQFMASEHDFAAYIERALPALQDAGVTGALLWCFADYAPELWSKPPCSESHHERFFGLVRPDGSLKPHAEVIRRFAATRPVAKPTPAYARLDVPPGSFYAGSPGAKLRGLYQGYLDRKAAASGGNDTVR